MKKLFIYLLLSSFILIGCGKLPPIYSYNVASLSSTVLSITSAQAKVKYILEFKQAETKIFSDEEWSALTDVDATINLIVLKYNTLIRADLEDTDLYEMVLLWDVVKLSYSKARQVILNHYSQFDTSSKMLLKSFDDEALKVSSKIDLLMVDPADENIKESIGLVLDVMNLAIKLISVAILL